MAKKRINVSLNSALVATLKTEKNKSGTNVSKIIEKALEAYFGYETVLDNKKPIEIPEIGYVDVFGMGTRFVLNKSMKQT